METKDKLQILLEQYFETTGQKLSIEEIVRLARLDIDVYNGPCNIFNNITQK